MEIKDIYLQYNKKTEYIMKRILVLFVSIFAFAALIKADDKPIPFDQLPDLAKTFITNRDNLDMYPALSKDTIEYVDNANIVHTLPASDIEGPGEILVAKKHVISLQTDRATQYQLYFDVQAQLYEAYTELRDSLSEARYGIPFEELDENQQMVCRLAYPIMISEAEPREYTK